VQAATPDVAARPNEHKSDFRESRLFKIFDFPVARISADGPNAFRLEMRRVLATHLMTSDYTWNGQFLGK
jgi:hypothetical protein